MTTSVVPDHRRPSAVGRRRRARHDHGRRLRASDPHLPEVASAAWSPKPRARIAPARSLPSCRRGSTAAIRRFASTSSRETAYVDVGAPLATGLHQVDNPVFDRDGNLYVTFSGSRGQQAPVSIFVVRRDGTREPFVTGIVNPTSMAIEPRWRLLRLEPVRRQRSIASNERRLGVRVATDLGVACGLAFDPDGTLFVGDRSGTSCASPTAAPTRSRRCRRASPHFTSRSARRLALRHRRRSRRTTWSIASPRTDDVDLCAGFGRPQGLAFDADGTCTSSMRSPAPAPSTLDPGRPASRSCVVAGGALVGLAFDPRGGARRVLERHGLSPPTAVGGCCPHAAPPSPRPVDTLHAPA